MSPTSYVFAHAKKATDSDEKAKYTPSGPATPQMQPTVKREASHLGSGLETIDPAQ